MDSSHGTRPEQARKADLSAQKKKDKTRLAKALRANLFRRKAAPRAGAPSPKEG